MLGITEMAFRLLPLSTKTHMGAKSFAHLFVIIIPINAFG